MKRASLIAASAALLILPLFASNAFAKNVNVNLRYVQTQLRTEQDVNNDAVVAYQLISHYKGSPGRAQSMGISEVLEMEGGGFFPGADFGCPQPAFPFALPIDILEDTLVFNDLSTLTLSRTTGDAVLCLGFGPAGLDSIAFGELEVTGGTGRFAGATGSVRFDAHLTSAPPPGIVYAVYEGTIEGTIHVP